MGELNEQEIEALLKNYETKPEDTTIGGIVLWTSIVISLAIGGYISYDAISEHNLKPYINDPKIQTYLGSAGLIMGVLATFIRLVMNQIQSSTRKLTEREKIGQKIRNRKAKIEN